VAEAPSSPALSDRHPAPAPTQMHNPQPTVAHLSKRAAPDDAQRLKVLGSQPRALHWVWWCLRVRRV
jgi:hypothetical protein